MCTHRMAAIVSFRLVLSRRSHSFQGSTARKSDNSIPFDWGFGNGRCETDYLLGQKSTITPSEAEIFKGIFEEIAQGKMPAAKRRSGESNFQSHYPIMESQPTVEKSRVSKFRQSILGRYPRSLQDAARVALGMVDNNLSNSETNPLQESKEAQARVIQELHQNETARLQEKKRVEALMEGCDTDTALWRVMEDEVFPLPEKLGIVQQKMIEHTECPNFGSKTAAPESPKNDYDTSQKVLLSQDDDQREEQRRLMATHGPLFPLFISNGLTGFVSAFARPSPFAFQILPRIAAMGLPAYVLGVSASFYVALARLHWDQFGDANSALDVFHEMNLFGLTMSVEVNELLTEMRDQLHRCAWGTQGSFVMSIMEYPPYDRLLIQRLEEMEELARQSIYERTSE